MINLAYKFKKISMNQLFKSALIVAVSLGASTSFAECNSDPELKLVKFPPSRLSAYVPKKTVINETVYDGPEDYDIHYNIQYKQQQIRVSLAAADFPNYDDSPYNVSTHKQTTQLTNVSPESKLIKLPCDDKICSSAYFGSNNSFNKGFTSIIRYSQSAKEQSIGDEFVKSLFVDTSDCVAAEPDSLTYNGPFQIYLLFKANSATLSDMSVHNPKMMGYFSQFVNRNNIKIHIEGHTDKTENIKDKISKIKCL